MDLTRWKPLIGLSLKGLTAFSRTTAAQGWLGRPPGWVVIKTDDGKEQTYETRPYLREKLTRAEGQSVVLMLDDENKNSDLASTGR